LDHVIGGPGAFVIAAESYETFADAILKKLIREMAANEPTSACGSVHAPSVQDDDAVIQMCAFTKF
jgi:Protein of unknown function (DUF1194)